MRPADLVRILRYRRFRTILLANASDCLDEEAVRALGSQHYLQMLDLSGTNLDEKWLQHLIPPGKSTGLKALLLRGVPLGEAGISSLRRFVPTRLDLTDTGIPPGLFESMLNLGNMISIDIGTTDGGATDAHARHVLGECPNLVALSIAGTLEPQSFEGVEKLIRCRCVMLEGMAITPSMTSLLSRMPGLHSIRFRRCVVAPEAWRNLNDCQQLFSFGVLETEFPFEAAEAFVKNPRLGRIFVDREGEFDHVALKAKFSQLGKRLDLTRLSEMERRAGTIWKCNNVY